MSLSQKIKASIKQAMVAIDDLALRGKIKRPVKEYDTATGAVTTTYKTANFVGAWDKETRTNSDGTADNTNVNISGERNIIIINDDVVYAPIAADELVIGTDLYTIIAVRSEPGNVAWTVRVQRKT
jgi:hypothetical protein